MQSDLCQPLRGSLGIAPLTGTISIHEYPALASRRAGIKGFPLVAAHPGDNEKTLFCQAS